jgi:hypothetical protein
VRVVRDEERNGHVEKRVATRERNGHVEKRVATTEEDTLKNVPPQGRGTDTLKNVPPQWDRGSRDRLKLDERWNFALPRFALPTRLTAKVPAKETSAGPAA